MSSLLYGTLAVLLLIGIAIAIILSNPYIAIITWFVGLTVCIYQIHRDRARYPLWTLLYYVGAIISGTLFLDKVKFFLSGEVSLVGNIIIAVMTTSALIIIGIALYQLINVIFKTIARKVNHPH